MRLVHVVEPRIMVKGSDGRQASAVADVKRSGGAMIPATRIRPES
jgi:hypothetical protein